MFEQDYKNAMEKISPDADTRDKILDKIILKEELTSHKNPALPWRIAFACVACIAIVLGIVFVPRDAFKQTPEISEVKQLTVTKSYDEIYKLIKPKKSLFANYGAKYNYATDDEDGVVLEIEESDTGTTSQSQNGAAAPGGTANKDAVGSDDMSKDDFSETTEQVEGVGEADIVKTDGKYIYYINDTQLNIFTANGEKSALVSSTELPGTKNDLFGEMFLKQDRLVLLKTDYYSGEWRSVLIMVYDISNPASPKLVGKSCQDGYYNSARMVGDYIYLISNSSINLSQIEKDDPSTFVPTIETDGECKTVPADRIYKYNKEEYSNRYTVISAFNYKDGILCDTASLLGGADNIYCSQGNIVLADTSYSEADENAEEISLVNTTVSRLEISDGKIEYKTSGEVEGTLDNQFYIDEYNGYFRFVTTVSTQKKTEQRFENTEKTIITYSNETSARLTVLDKDLKSVGKIEDLAQGERVYSVRFMGDTAYFVTFRQTDPLFSVDLSDPKNPKILGALKIPGFSAYMYPYTDNLLLGFGMDADEKTGRTGGLKLSMFNITDRANVIEDDKTVLENYVYSPALSDHKAMLVSPDKNIIGFAATDNYSNIKYLIYEYTGESFERKAALTVSDSYNYYAMTDIRGIYINDSFYVISQSALQVFDINTFLQINRIDF